MRLLTVDAHLLGISQVLRSASKLDVVLNAVAATFILDVDDVCMAIHTHTIHALSMASIYPILDSPRRITLLFAPLLSSPLPLPRSSS